MISASKIYAQNNQNLKHINNPVILTDENTKYPLGLHLEIFEDQTRELTIEDVVNQEFTPSNQNIPNLGVKTSAIWVRFRVKNQASLTQKWILSLNDARVGTVDFYYSQRNKKEFKIIKTGRFLPFKTREFNHRFFIFSLPFTEDNEKTIYLRLTSKAGLAIPLNIYSLETFFQEDQNNILFLGIGYGAILIMIGYNLFLFISLKDKSYLDFVLFLAGYLWFKLCLEGIGHQFLWNNFPNYYEIQVLGSLLLLFFWIKFTQSFLKTKKYVPQMDRFLFIISLFIVMTIIISTPTKWIGFMLNFHSIFIRVIVLITALIRWRQGYKPTKYFLLAIFVPTVVEILIGFSILGFIPYNIHLSKLWDVNFNLLVLLFSFALADRINLIQDEREKAQNQALKNAELNQKLIQEQNIVLEKKVVERTEQLSIAKEKAEVANQAKSSFIANMSHELRTPLNAILGFSQIMMRSPTLSPEEKENTAIINKSGNYLLTLINNILDLSKIEAGKMTLNAKTFDFYSFLNELEDLLHITAENKGLTLIFDHQNDVPQYIYTDETKLRQVLINLINNGIKFTSEGGVSVTVATQKESPLNSPLARGESSGKNPSFERGKSHQKATLIFEVRDTGAGIAEDETPKLFEAFTQTETGKNSQEGTGLGLPISRKFVQLMGGDITVNSQVGKGTTFRFQIQVNVANKTDIEIEQNPRHVIALKPHQPRYKILIVDDRPTNRLLLIKLLQPLGFELKEAENGKQGIEIWEKWQPHLIWMDMRMPVMDGYEATQIIKGTTKGNATAIIALTASVLEEQKAIILSAGCDDFVRKPFRESIIFETMKKHLGVEYIYEQETPAPTASELPSLTVEDLQVMPSEWLEELYDATKALDDDSILELIEKIPVEQSLLAEKLSNLVDDFQFKTIRKLLEYFL
ncbi:MAG: response regulator [Okeania sp. SIO2C9]|uniref:hybrid sensor histidine kinase/response regulator n=1 Tax=Okeania sp. SIO2C9 TaxID=2607791 RepID=UPI0013C21174|nr:hybrid sensor histidine kinase/response regulator [Okeania sp. SIO2C9]NEQ75509.1 response regulator [Okeania sp. SIO2C9]